MSLILDTNVISELRKPEPDQLVARWYGSVPDTEIYISVLVLGKIRQGIERLRRRDQAQADVFASWLAMLRRDYGERILPITDDVVEEWGSLNVPDPLPVVDGLLAATAKVRGWTLVTRNTRHVERTGVRLLNPFEP